MASVVHSHEMSAFISTLEASSPDEQASEPLRDVLEDLVSEASEQSASYHAWAQLWRTTDLVVGLATAVLTAVAGATGLASTAGRIPAAIMALGAVALTAAARFLRSDQRYETNRRRHIAWEVLRRDARLAGAVSEYASAQDLCDVIRDLLQRRSAIMSMDHYPLPPEVVHKQASRPQDHSAEQLLRKAEGSRGAGEREQPRLAISGKGAAGPRGAAQTLNRPKQRPDG